MIYTGIECEKCGNLFTEDDDVVVCPVCGAPHHRDCWLKDSMCAHSNEHQSGYQWIMPNISAPNEETERKRPADNEFILKNGENVIVCPNCGAMNCENDAYCMRCGVPLKEMPYGQNQNANGNFEENTANFNRQRMYDDFNRFGGLNPMSELDSIPVNEYSTFVGGKTPGKIIRKIAIMDRFGKSVSWCWPAVFIGPVWFFWRKMKKEGLIISLILLLFCTAAGLLQINAPLEKFYNDTFTAFNQLLNGEISREELQQAMDDNANIYSYAELTEEESRKATFATVFNYLAEPGIAILCSATAMYFYKKKVKQSILQIREKCTNMEQYRETLAVEGGTSVGWAIVGAVLYIAAFFCLNYLPMLIILLK